MKRLLPLLTILSSFAALAVPEVSEVTMSQNGRRVTTIEYRLSEAPVILTVDIQTNANRSLDQADPGWVSIGAENFTNLVGHAGTLVMSAGVNRLVWDARASWPEHKTKGARAVLTVWPTNAEHWAANTEFWERMAAEAAAEAERQRLLKHPLYMVVDLEAEPGANVTYYTAESELPGGIGSDVYRTTKMVFRKIQAFGKTAKLGAPAGQVGRRDNSELVHYVKFSHDYYLGVFEVTQKQYSLVFGSNPSSVSQGDESVWGTRPVENVHFTHWGNPANAAQKHHLRDPDTWPGESEAAGHAVTLESSFIYQFRARTGLGDYLDLPTYSQWEYAARAGTETALYTGEELASDDLTQAQSALEGIARYYANSGAAAPDLTDATGALATARVGSYAPNAWGLYDMYGNVAELCLDYWGTFAANTEDTPTVDERGPVGYSGNAESVGAGAYNCHVAAGGSWRSSSAKVACRSSAHAAAKFETSVNPLAAGGTGSQGFRLALTVAD
ncbi:MAG: formylglycine-generating enzyme family protein [Kiritimatiellia bacterium]